jgi:transposase
MYKKKKKHLPTIRKITDDLWDEIKLVLQPEKRDKTIGVPIVAFRRVLDPILYVLRTDCQWGMVLALLHVT